MNSLELKGSLLQLIANIKDEKLLLDLYKTLTDHFQKQDKDWWEELNRSQQQELDNAIEETYKPTNLSPPHSQYTAPTYPNNNPLQFFLKIHILKSRLKKYLCSK